MDNACIFCRIASGELNADIVYDDEQVVAFKDINPVRPIHVLVIPKKHIVSLATVTEQDKAIMADTMTAIPRIAEQLGCHDGFRVITNAGRIGQQEVKHLHWHLLSGPEPLGSMIKPIR